MEENNCKTGDGAYKYGRDYLLQLRMHPLSLQKPKNLPQTASDIIKDRLYLHQIDNIGSQYMSDPPYQSYHSDINRCLTKPENISKYLHQCSLPAYVPRGSFYPGPKYNSAVPIPKYRSTYSPTFYNSHSKPPYRGGAYKAELTSEDFFENITDIQTAPWFKDTFPIYTPENAWNLNQKVLETKTCSSQHDNTNYPKSKKKLSIIDPKTGKDILDEIIETSTNSQSSMSSKENTEEETKTLSSDAAAESSDQQEKMTYLDGDSNGYEDVGLNTISEEEYHYLSSKQSGGDSAVLSMNQDSSDEEFLKEYASCMHPANHEKVESGDSEKNTYRTYTLDEACEDKNKLYSIPNIDLNVKNDAVFSDKRGSFEKNDGKTRPISLKMANETKDSAINQDRIESNLKEKIIMLRDKIYSMKQEQQKMAIMQSFLRFKKHQLDESFRNLDEKKIDIVNWEYNLYNKTKKLHEKEYWLETKNRSLKKKEKQLEEKEKWLEMKQKDIENKYNVILNEPCYTEGHTIIENYATAQIGVNGEYANKVEDDSKKLNTIQTDLDEYSFGVECRTQGTSAEIVKQNVDGSLDFKHAYQKEFQPSEGRRYMPEHIKYWLNKKDSKVEEMLQNGEHEPESGKKSEIEKTNTFEQLKIDQPETQTAPYKKLKTDELTPSTKSTTETHKKFISSEGRKYFPEHIKFWLNQEDANRSDDNGKDIDKVRSNKIEMSYKEKWDYKHKDRKIDAKSDVKSKEYTYGDIQMADTYDSSPRSRSPSKKVNPSEGRKYFPEHIKYYLNKEDRKIQEKHGRVERQTENQQAKSNKVNAVGKYNHKVEVPKKDSRSHNLFRETKTPVMNQNSKNNDDISLNSKYSSHRRSYPSEGRKYFPEHIKYWLNEEDNKQKNTTRVHRDSTEKKMSGKKEATNKVHDEKYKEPKQDDKNHPLKSKDYSHGDISETISSKDPKSDKISLGSKTPLPSEGRKYFQEPVKYWLNQKDKKMQENVKRFENKTV